MKSGDFHGNKTVVLENEHFRLECLAEAGPRIVRLIPMWTGENLFAEEPNMTTRTPMGEFHFYGGHRLWHAPESLSQTYCPDDAGLSVKQIHDGVRLTGPVEPRNGIRKTITIQTSPNRPFIIVKHKLENLGQGSIQLAPWALTMMRTRGVAILPQEKGNTDDGGLLPNRRFALWPYSRWDDPRLLLGEEFIQVKSDSNHQALKIGYFNPHGWLGYAYDDVLFVKRFGVRRDEEYPDFGCNSEVYVNHRFTEIESLGPVIRLEPREEVVHTETWEIHKDSEIPKELLGGKTLEGFLR